jgi:two-component system KDP operon response regulator KdpE
MNKAEILLIDDEDSILKLLEINLHANGFKVLKARTGAEGLRMAQSHAPQLVILDLGLPDVSGQEVLTRLKSCFLRPVIILSAVHEESAIIQALDAGAADYLTKPFRTGELMARVRSALRRYYVEEESPLLKSGSLVLDPTARTVAHNNDALKLTATEFDLLALFMRNEGRVLTHQYLLREVWGAHYEDQTQYLRVFVNTLRKKLETVGMQACIQTEIGIGYRFV